MKEEEEEDYLSDEEEVSKSREKQGTITAVTPQKGKSTLMAEGS